MEPLEAHNRKVQQDHAVLRCEKELHDLIEVIRYIEDRAENEKEN